MCPGGHTGTELAISLPHVPSDLLCQPVHLHAGLRSLLSPVPLLDLELGLIVDDGGLEGVDDVLCVPGAVLLVLAGVGPLLGLDLLREGDDLAGEVSEASVRINVSSFLLFVGESTDRNGFLPTVVFRNPNPTVPSLTSSGCSPSSSATCDLTLRMLVLF